MLAVILAGGKGVRLHPLTVDLPKPMIEIAGKPVLEHQLLVLKEHGVNKAIILAGYLGQKIVDYFGDGSDWGISISYRQETVPLGTAGAVKALQDELNDDFLLVYGDVFFDFDIDMAVSLHRQSGAAATLVAHPTDHPQDSDLLDLDAAQNITEIIKKPHAGGLGNIGNAAFYVLSPRVFPYIPEGKADFMHDVFPQMLENGEHLVAYKTAEYLKDMGTVERLQTVRQDYVSGRIERCSQKTPRPAIFIDRDGTLIEDVDLLHRAEDLVLFQTVPAALKRLNNADFLCLLATNQPVVARNLCSLEELHRINKTFESLLGESGCHLDQLFFCPHHPDAGYPEENPAFKIRCDCRKPAIGMIRQAQDMFNIDMSRSWFVGDTTIDLQTGKNAGLRTILVRTGKGGLDGKYSVTADHVAEDFATAVEHILACEKNRPTPDCQ